MSDYKNLQIERLGPNRIYAAMKEQPVIYMPLGAIEWHGLHLPIGLDSMTSHSICLRVADRVGGLVMPPLYYGMTGSIGHHPWTILLEKEETFEQIIRDTLNRLEAFGVKVAVVFTGHFGRRQLAALEALSKSWKEEKHSLQLLYLSISQCPTVEMRGDHGAIFETSLLKQLEPDLVWLDNLPPQETHPANDPRGDSWGDHRRDPDNVLFGVLGDDPRDYDEEQARVLLQKITDWVASETTSTLKLKP